MGAKLDTLKGHGAEQKQEWVGPKTRNPGKGMGGSGNPNPESSFSGKPEILKEVGGKPKTLKRVGGCKT